MSDVLKIDNEIDDNGRFSRLELIDWWDQDRLAEARVLVIGAGAIGNELIKNLALLGVGNLFIADLDRIENSNLSRSILFREADCGSSKAEIAARSARDIYPRQRTRAWQGNVVYNLGLGVYRWADVILGGLDNREARVAINRAAAKLGKPWIDGAIERLDGVARVFDPSTGPCYECTMSATDWKMLEARRSCALLSREEMEEGKVPTTPTTASVIAGIQVQEALKMLHNMDGLSGQGFVFEGMNHQSYLVNYSKLEGCPAHEALGPIEQLTAKVSETLVGELLERLRSDLGADVVIETNEDLIESFVCAQCGETEPYLSSLGGVTQNRSLCPQCGMLRTPILYHTIQSDSKHLDRTLAELGIPAWDILGGRAGLEHRYYEFAGDQAEVLGTLADSEGIS